MDWQCAVLHHTIFLFGLDPVYRVSFSSVFSLSGTTGSFVILTKSAIVCISKCIANILCPGATGRKHGRHPILHPLPEGPTSSVFNFEHFRWLGAEWPETVVNSWHLRFPWSQLACEKDSFFPLEIMYFPGAVQMRQMRDLFWPPSEKTPATSRRGPKKDWLTWDLRVRRQLISLKWF